jgi:hypothetical protein
MHYAAETMTDFMLNVDFISKKPDLKAIFNDRFVQEAYARESAAN